MKKISLALVLVLTLSLLTAFGGVQAAEKEPVTVTLTLTNAGWPDQVWRETHDWVNLRDELGITLEYEYQTEEQFGIMLASGDLSDIVSPRQRFLPAIIESNLALDLEPIIDSHIPNLNLDIFKYSVQLSKLFMGGPDNKLFFLAPCIGPESANMSDTMSRGYALRWDLYAQLGYPEITSDADYLQILQDMHALFPTTPDGRPVYAMGLISPSNMFQEWHQRGAFIREGTTGNFWTYNGYLYAASYENMELINGYMDPNSFHWVDMKFYNSLWNLGLLDPDSFTMTTGDRREKMEAMQYLAHVVRDTALWNIKRAEDPNTDIAIVVVPSSNAVMGGNKLSPAGGMPTDSTFIYANSKNWEAAAAVLNYYRDPEVLRLQYSGVEGLDWFKDENGVTRLTDKAISERISLGVGTEAYRRETGIISTIWDWTPTNSTAIHPDGFFIDVGQEFEYRALSLNPVYRHMAEYWGVDTPSRYYSQMVADGVTIDWRNDYAQVIAMGCTDIPTDILRIMNNVNEITVRYIPELVMAATEAEFEAIQQRYWADIAAVGQETAWEWCKDAYYAAKVLVDPIFAEARAATDAKLAAAPAR